MFTIVNHWFNVLYSYYHIFFIHLQLWVFLGPQMVIRKEIWSGGMRNSHSSNETSHRQEHRIWSREHSHGNASQRSSQRIGKCLSQTAQSDIHTVCQSWGSRRRIGWCEVSLGYLHWEVNLGFCFCVLGVLREMFQVEPCNEQEHSIGCCC